MAAILIFVVTGVAWHVLVKSLPFNQMYHSKVALKCIDPYSFQFRDGGGGCLFAPQVEQSFLLNK